MTDWQPPNVERHPHASSWQIVATVSLGTTMLVLSGTVLNIALPLIAQHYNAGPLAATWGAFCLPRSEPGSRSPVDIVGAALLTGWIALAVLVVSQPGSGDWRTAPRLIPLILLPLVFTAFALRQRYARTPLIDPDLFSTRAFVLGNLAAPLSATGQVGMAFALALYLQSVQGMSTVEAGLAVLAGPLVGMVAPPISGRLGARYPPQYIAVCGTTAAAAGLALLAVCLSERTPYPLIACGMVLVSAGAGVFYAANTTVLIMGVPPERLGVVNGVRLTVHFLGVALSPAICLAVVSSALPAADRHVLYATAETRPPPDIREALVSGYKLSFVLFALAAVAAAALAAFIPKAHGRSPGRQDDGSAAGSRLPPEPSAG